MYQLLLRFTATAFVLLAATAAPPTALADEERSAVLGPEVDGIATSALLQQCLLRQLRPHFEERRAAVAAITTPEQFQARQTELRKRLEKINGPLPSKTALNGRVVGKIERHGYVIEKVIYESRPGHHVTANFYLPTGASRPVPGVLVPCGHSANGKASGVYQSICISLAQQGIAALIYDPIGQGERHQLLAGDGQPVVQGTNEHTLIGVGSWLVGTGTQNYRIWDGIRSLDYLTQRPEVDADRIGCTGNSGGGTMTSYLMAFDRRIKAAAPSCYLTTLERLFDTIGPQDAEQNFPGQVALGIDHADYIHLHAPLPTLMCVATQDFFDNDGAWTTFREAKQIYSMLGHSERMGIIDYDDEHGFSKPRRVAAMRFMKRWLLSEDDNPDEGELTLSTDEELQCTKSGEVLLDFENTVSCFDITRERAAELASARQAVWRDSPQQGLAAAKRLSGFRDSPSVPRVILHRSERIDAEANLGWNGTLDKLTLSGEDGMLVPALLFRPAGFTGRRPAVVYASSTGKADSLNPRGRCARLAAEGTLVLAVDLRGFGETRAAVQRRRNGYFGTDFKTALLAIHLNRPLVGQRAEDLQRAFNFLESREDVARGELSLIVEGQAGPAGIHLAAFDRRIAALTVAGSIQSWQQVLAEPLAVDQLTNVVPFALESYDLPDLLAAINPRTVTLEAPVDATGKPIAASD